MKLTSGLKGIFCDKILIDTPVKENFPGQEAIAPLRIAGSSNQFCLFLNLFLSIIFYLFIKQFLYYYIIC